jgi:hypothetical protein
MRKSITPCHALLSLVALLISASAQAQLSDVTQPGDPIVATSNNSPGSEGVANAIDNAPTKYLNFDKVNTGFTVTPRVGLTIVRGLTLTSANDAPDRDPADYTLEGSYDGVTFTAISSGAVPAFGTTRFLKVGISFDNEIPYLSYRLIFPNTAGNSTCCMQVSEVEFLGVLAPSDVTQPGDPIVATSNNSPGSEGVANAIDNAPTKYLNFDKVNTGFTVTPSVGPTRVTGLTLTSANDAPDRDPATYLLEGSLDGVTFFEIASGDVPAFGTTRFLKNYVFFPNDRAFKAYRLIFPTTAGNSTCCMQVSEVELLGVVADLAQDVTQPGDPIVATSNNSPGSEGVANAIDNAPTKYLNFDKVNTGFTVTPRAGLTIVSGLTLTSANDAPDRDPADYTLEGSYDGVTFTAISSGAVPSFGTTRFLKNTVLFPNKVPYLSYRLIFPNTAGNSTCCMQISEVEFLGVLAPTDVTVPGDPIVATSNNSPGSEGVANAIDNAPTKYLNFDKVNTGFTVTPSVGETIVTGLTLTSANDAPDRDPADYELSGSNDGGATFTPIASGPVPSFGTTRFLKNYVFFPDNNKSYKSYKLIFPNTAGNSTCCMQISEVEFLGITPGVVNTNAVDTLIRRQPQDTPVLLGSQATFRVGLTGPWSVQWFRNGERIAGANNAVYQTPPATAGDDGAIFHAVVQGRDGRQTSDQAMLSIFTPSTTESLGFSWIGDGANGAPTDMLLDDITGFHAQAFWNNLDGGAGTLASPLNSDNLAHPTVQVAWATSGEWGVGTGEDDALSRLFNGTSTIFATTEAGAQTVTLSGVPAGRHSLLLYTVQVPAEFFNVNFKVTTFKSDGSAKAVQSRFTRPQNADEFNASPGFLLMTSEDAANRSVGNMMRFDGLETENGTIALTMWSPGRAQPAGQDPIRGPTLNAFQLLIDPPDVGASPNITVQPVSANALLGGTATLKVTATGPNLSYQWLKDGRPINGANSATLILNDLKASDAGVYSVAISNPAGRVRSRNVSVGILSSRELTLGLVNYFKLDETTGNVAPNSVAGGLPGEVRGQFQDWTPEGKIDGALLFEGDNVVFVPDYTKPREAITVAGWVYAATADWGPLVNNWVTRGSAGLSGQFLLEVVVVDGVPTLRAVIEVGPNKVIASAPVDGSVATWHHFALTANGLSLDAYWDGQLVASTDYSGQVGNNVPEIPWLALGAELTADPNVPLKLLPGTDSRLDDVAMWNRSLTGPEILAIYNGGNAGQNISEVPPVINPLLRLSAARNAGSLQISATGSPGSTWRIESNTAVSPTGWQTVQNVTLGAAPVTVTQPLTGAQVFYRGVFVP